jgi:hypothetical protein
MFDMVVVVQIDRGGGCVTEVREEVVCAEVMRRT